MQRQRKIAIKTIVFSFLAIFSLTLMDTFLFTPISSSYSSFYEEKKDSLDVVLIGNSTLREGYIPILSYHECGFTNYSITASPTRLEVLKLAIEETARTQSPKMVFVDLSGLTFQSHANQQMYVKEFVAAMPECEAKESYYHRYDYLRRDEKDFLFTYHNSFRQQIYWESLIYKKAAHSKGYFPNEIVISVAPAPIDKTKTLPLSEDASLYVKEILEVAGNYPKIDFIFGRMPRVFSNAVAEETYIVRSAKSAVESAGHEFIDFTEYWQDIGLDPAADQKDNEHLNHRGAVKFTRYFGDFVCERYGFKEHPPHHDKDVIESFDRCYDEYEKMIAPIEEKFGMKR